MSCFGSYEVIQQLGLRKEDLVEVVGKIAPRTKETLKGTTTISVEQQGSIRKIDPANYTECAIIMKTEEALTSETRNFLPQKEESGNMAEFYAYSQEEEF